MRELRRRALRVIYDAPGRKVFRFGSESDIFTRYDLRFYPEKKKKNSKTVVLKQLFFMRPMCRGVFARAYRFRPQRVFKAGPRVAHRVFAYPFRRRYVIITPAGPRHCLVRNASRERFSRALVRIKRLCSPLKQRGAIHGGKNLFRPYKKGEFVSLEKKKKKIAHLFNFSV